MDIGIDITLTDFPYMDKAGMIPFEKMWGSILLENVIDSVACTGAQQMHLRVHAPGPLWPTKIREAYPMNWDFLFKEKGWRPLLSEWDMPGEAVRAAHVKDLKIFAWFDMVEGHGGLPTIWSLRHPEYCIVNREGVRLDGLYGIRDMIGMPALEQLPGMHFYKLREKGIIDSHCNRPDGIHCDAQLSLAFPEVVEYRLSLIRELVRYGFDGLHLAANNCVGFEEPVRKEFMELYGEELCKVPDDDHRWLKLQRKYFNAFLSKLREMIKEETKGKTERFELIIEGQRTGEGNEERCSEQGWENIPYWAGIPGFVDAESIADDALADCLIFWRFGEIDELGDDTRGKIRIGTRYRGIKPKRFVKEEYEKRLRGAERRGVDLFVLNEARVSLFEDRWIYQRRPGALFTLY